MTEFGDLKYGKSYRFPPKASWAGEPHPWTGAVEYPAGLERVEGQGFKVVGAVTPAGRGMEVQVQLDNKLFMTITSRMFTPGTTFKTAEAYSTEQMGETGVAAASMGVPQDVIDKIQTFYGMSVKKAGRKSRRRIAKRKSTRKLRSRSRRLRSSSA